MLLLIAFAGPCWEPMPEMPGVTEAVFWYGSRMGWIRQAGGRPEVSKMEFRIYLFNIMPMELGRGCEVSMDVEANLMSECMHFNLKYHFPSWWKQRIECQADLHLTSHFSSGLFFPLKIYLFI